MADQLSLFAVQLDTAQRPAQARTAASRRPPPTYPCRECAKPVKGWNEAPLCRACLKAVAAARAKADQLDRDPHRYDPATAPWPEGF